MMQSFLVRLYLMVNSVWTHSYLSPHDLLLYDCSNLHPLVAINLAGLYHISWVH